jgi:murein DD-endopeptidase MepM/ murein hydrolase activator NlpD
MRITALAVALAISALSGSLTAAKPVQSAFHKVHRGETAARIARDNGLTLAQLEAINPGLDLDHLVAGARVKVRGKAPVAASHRNVAPMPPLPGTPAPGPTSFTHMERTLPAPVRTVASLEEARPALAGIQPVLPPADPDDLVYSTSGTVQGFEPADPDRLDLLWPVETRTVSSAWGPRMRSKTIKVKASKRRVKYRGSHKGIDLTAPTGTTVFAAMDGQVVAVGKQKGYGNYVVLDHGNGVVTLYGHHKRNFVTGGEIVHRGQKIAEVGRTGNATGPHLHFELRVDGAVRNPLPVLNDAEEIPADQIAQNRAAVAPKTRR